MPSLRILIAAASLVLLPSFTAAALCTGPGGANVLAEPHPGGPVLGGVAANQCGFELTADCQGGYCFGFFDGLSGYIEQSALTGPASAPLTGFSYRPVRADGTLQMMGRSAPFEIDDTAAMDVAIAPGRATLQMPAPWSAQIPLQKTGSSTWDGQSQDWMGVPISVIYEFDQLGAQKARLRLIADHMMLKMDVLLHLERVGGPKQAAAAGEVEQPVSAVKEPDVCDLVDGKAQAILASGSDEAATALMNSVAAIGISDWAAKTSEQCKQLAAAMAPGAMPAARPSPQPEALAEPAIADRAVCTDLAADLRPILREPGHPGHRAVLSEMLILGISSLASATPDQCFQLGSALGMGGPQN